MRVKLPSRLVSGATQQAVAERGPISTSVALLVVAERAGLGEAPDRKRLGRA
jgi:hypothetical protein